MVPPSAGGAAESRPDGAARGSATERRADEAAERRADGATRVSATGRKADVDFSVVDCTRGRPHELPAGA
jgi:hypothetical protein